jgi:hypothetical protein
LDLVVGRIVNLSDNFVGHGFGSELVGIVA